MEAAVFSGASHCFKTELRKTMGPGLILWGASLNSGSRQKTMEPAVFSGTSHCFTTARRKTMGAVLILWSASLNSGSRRKTMEDYRNFRAFANKEQEIKKVGVPSTPPRL